MSEIKVNSIKGTGASSAAITVHTSDGTATGKFTNIPGRNLVINGAMQVAQYGTSSTTSSSYTCDRFHLTYSGQDEAPTFSQADVTSGGAYDAGFRKCLKVVNGNQTSGAGASDIIQIRYRIEQQDLAQSGWNYTSASSYITLSFWIKSSVGQAFTGSFFTNDGTAKAYKFSTPYLSANTWTKVTKTIPGHADLTINTGNGIGITLFLFPFIGTTWTSSDSTTETWVSNAGTNHANTNTTTWWTTNDATYELTGVQIEVGDVATDFEHRSYGEELARCQRYYEGLHMNAGTAMWISWASGSSQKMEYSFKVTKRAVPTSQLEGNASWSGATPLSFHSTNIAGFHHANTAYSLSDSNGDLCYSFSAEL